MRSNLRDTVRSMLQERAKTKPLKHIAKEADADYFFVRRLVNGGNQEHSAEKLEHLYRYLTGRELQL